MCVIYTNIYIYVCVYKGGLSWGILEPLGGPPGTHGGRLGALLGPWGRFTRRGTRANPRQTRRTIWLIAPSWLRCLLGPSWAVFGLSWAVCRCSNAVKDPWGHSWASSKRAAFGAFLSHWTSRREPLGVRLGRSRGVFRLSTAPGNAFSAEAPKQTRGNLVEQ